MKQSMTYQNIDMVKTGINLKKFISNAGMSVKDIQDYLHLSCPQPIYRWMSGKILPSVDHLLMLSELFGVHMEELLVKKRRWIPLEYFLSDDRKYQERLTVYYKTYYNIVHLNTES